MRRLVEQIIRERHPIELVRQSSKRLKTPRTLVVTAACLGLRVSARSFAMGKTWTLELSRSRFNEVLCGVCFIPLRQKRLKAHSPLTRIWQRRSWPIRRGPSMSPIRTSRSPAPLEKPRWPKTILADYIKPAASRAGIGKFGWHTFRHYVPFLGMSCNRSPALCFRPTLMVAST